MGVLCPLSDLAPVEIAELTENIPSDIIPYNRCAASEYETSGSNFKMPLVALHGSRGTLNY